MVNYGVLYAITAGVGALVIAVILNRLLSTEYKELIDRKLVNLCRFLLAFCIADMIWGVLSSRLFIISQFWYTISTYSFHLGAALSAYFWAGYVISYINERKTIVNILNVLRGILIFVQVSVLFSNIWNRRFFYVNEDAVYESYQLRNFMFFLQFTYYIILIVFGIVKLIYLRFTSNELRQEYKTAIIYSFVPLAFGLGQMYWPDAPMYSLGFMLTAMLIYSINITAFREKYLATFFKNENEKLYTMVSALSNDYQAIYSVNLSTGKYERTVQTPQYEKVRNERLEKGDDFYKDLSLQLGNIINPDDVEYVKEMVSRENIQKELSKKNSFSFNYRVGKGKAAKYYMIKVNRPDIAGKEYVNRDVVVIGVFDDNDRVKEEKKQREALTKAMKEAEEANKAKSRFLFNMSHDIRTPMNAIIGFTAIAKKHIDDKKYVTECLDKVTLSSNHLLSLINDILDMSRIESGKLIISSAPESIIEKNDQIVSIIEELASSKSIIFTHEVSIENEYIYADALHVNQILMNILSNAIKYTPPGGKVHYSLKQLDSEREGTVKLKFTVQDNGIGMSRTFLSKLYDEFERENTATASGIEGTGLGMSIVKRLVDLMNGDIHVESSQGKGTKVECILSFRVAMRKPASSGDVSISSDTPLTLPSGKRVLLVDDNVLNREIAADTLTDMGLSVEEVSDGEDAVKAVSEKKAGYYDIVLMDIQMPKMDGYTATRAIRALKDKDKAIIPIIAMTANAFDEDKKNAFEAGMNGHLAKPIAPALIANELLKYL